MKICIGSLLLVAVVLTAASCSKDDTNVVGSPEEVLPGTWKIESVSLTDYPMGVSYLGNTFFNDTTLYNVGSIDIDVFSADSIELIDLEQHRVKCELTISGGQMAVSINSLFVNGNEFQMAIRYNGPGGPQPIDTPVEEFYHSSHIFNNFYTLKISADDKVRLFTSNVNENHVITLVRK